jgi:hypothetical protein
MYSLAAALRRDHQLDMVASVLNLRDPYTKIFFGLIWPGFAG